MLISVQIAIDCSHLASVSCYIESGIMIRSRRGVSLVGECENDKPEKGTVCCYNWDLGVLVVRSKSKIGESLAGPLPP